MTRVYVSVGSNIDRHINIYAGMNALKQRFHEPQLSSIYETEAVGFDGDPFYNLVAAFDTNESPEAVNQFLKAVEEMQGREREENKFSSRTLDMDLLLYGDRQMDLPGLQIPREEIYKYVFVLEPLAEIAADMVCPGDTRTFAQLWQVFKDENQAPQSRVVDWDIL